MSYVLSLYRKHLLSLSFDFGVQWSLSIYYDKKVSGWILGGLRNPVSNDIVGGIFYCHHTLVHDKGSLPEKSGCLFYGIKRDGVYRFIVHFSRRMDSGKN